MISPEDDFDTWSTVFQATCEPNGDYLLLLPDFHRLLSYYVDNAKLPEPIVDQTQEFSDDTVLTILRLIFNLSSISESELAQLKKEIKSIINFSTSGYIHSIPNSSKYLEYCLMASHNFYQKNSISYSNLNTTFESLYTEIFCYFLHEGPTDHLIDFINQQPTIDHLSFFLSLISQPVNNFQPGDTTNILSKLQKSLLSFFSQFDDSNIRNIDRNLLTTITRSILTFLNLNEVLFPLRISLLKFGDLCLRCNYVDKNLIGSNIIVKIAEIDPASFRQFATETHLLDFVLTKDIHESVLTELSPVVPKMLDKLLPPALDQLQSVFNRATLSVPSQKSALNSLLANLLKICPEEIIVSFLHSITDNKQLSKEFVNFLEQFIKASSSTHSNSVAYVTRFTLHLLDEGTQNTDILNEAVKTLCNSTITDSFRKTVYAYLFERIQKLPFRKEQYKAIKMLIRAVIADGTEEVKKLIQICIDNKQLKLVKTILIYSQTKLQPMTIHNMVYNDEGWEVLYKVINKRGTDIFYEINELQHILNRLDIKHATIKHFYILREILVSQNIRSKKLATHVKSGPIGLNFCVINPKIDSIDLLIKFITRSEDKIVNQTALDFLLLLYKDVKQDFFELFAFSIVNDLDENDVILLIKESPPDFEPYLLIDDQLYLSKLIHMVNSMIQLAEKNIDITNFGIERHKNKHKYDFPITVKYQEEEKQIIVNPKTTILDLKSKILFKFKKEKAIIRLITTNNVNLNSNETIAATNIKANDVLIVTSQDPLIDLRNPPETCMTQIIASTHIQTLYYRLIHFENLEKDLQKSIWTFLMLMPSITGIDLDRLTTSKTQLEIRYILQYFLNNPQVVNDRIYSTVISMICNKKIESFALGDALNLINNHFIFSNNKYLSTLINFLLNSMLNQDASKLQCLILDILISLAKLYKDLVTSELLSNETIFENLILSSSIPILDKLATFFENLSEKPRIFSLLVSFIEKVYKTSDKLHYYLKILPNIFDSSCDYGQAIQMCIEMIKTTNEDTIKFTSCAFLYDLFTKQPMLLTNCPLIPDLFELLLKSIFTITENDIQAMIINLIELFCQSNHRFFEQFKMLFKKQFEAIETDRWCYDPLINMKSQTGFTGLKNLGATCYMNSIFQQLYFNHEFRHNLINLRPNEKWIIELRNLFLTMMFTKEKVADTTKFVESWRPHKEPTNPREQQDACEFLLLLLDNLKDELFKGELISVNEGEHEPFHSETNEVFWNIQLDVKGCKSFEESLNSFLQKESISDYFAENLRKKIDIVHYFRIRKLPKYLVVQLKRFEYDVNTWRKVKINDRFTFPTYFDISSLLEHAESKQNYSLIGIVIHCGTMDCGHYTSYIKHDDKWYSFNDGIVDRAIEKNLLEEAYGYNRTDKSSYEYNFAERKSAYLLFYVQSELLLQNTDQKEITIDETLDSNLLKAIEDQNSKLIQMQSSFTPAILNAVMKSNDLDLIITYLINIFCHSHHGGLADKFARHISSLFSERTTNESCGDTSIDHNHNSDKNVKYNKTIQKFIDNSEKIFDTFVNCTNTSITKCLSRVITDLLINSSIENSRIFVMSMIIYIKKILDNWRCIHQFFELIVLHCNQDTTWIRENNWPVLLLEYITDALKNSKSFVYLTNVDFSSYFSFIDSHINDNILDSQHLIELCSLGQLVLQSRAHSTQFISVVVKCSDKKMINLNQFIENLLADVKDPSSNTVLSLFLQFSDQPHIIEQFIESPHISKQSLTQEIEEKLHNSIMQQVYDNSLQLKLIHSPKILFYLITCDDPKATRTMEGVYLSLFPSISPLYSFSRAEKALKNANFFKSNFKWDDRYNTAALGEDYQQMCILINSALDGLNEMNLNPQKFFSGLRINRRFNNFIRVIFWLIHRTRIELEKEKMEIILNFFNTLNALGIKNNSTMIEMIRLLRVLPQRQMIYDLFVHLSDIIFRSDFTPILHEFAFTVFMESFKSDFLSYPHLFEALLIKVQGFAFSFKVVAETNRDDVLDDFAHIIIHNKVDISSLIEHNVNALRKSNPIFLILVLPFATLFRQSFKSDADVLEELILHLLNFLCSENCNAHNLVDLNPSFNYLHEEMSKTKCFVDINQYIGLIPRNITKLKGFLSDSIHHSLNQSIQTLLDDLSSCNEVFKQAIISNS